jgi:hypothetical protein
MSAWRSPSPSERALLVRLGGLAHLPSDWLDRVRVREMPDGGMGSLQLSIDDESGSRFGETVAELRFADRDGVPVLVSLNVDQEGRPFELDIWKTDFSPLIQIPEDF